MNIPENTVRDYYRDVELHAYIALDMVSMGAKCDAQWILDSEVEYRAVLLAEKFLEDADTIETDLRRCMFKMRTGR